MDNKSINLHFLGAAGTVTGSKYLIETEEENIMIDCGLFQGLKSLRELNWNYLPIDVTSINAILLTHGHLDHVGFLPRLVKMGFKGIIYGTPPTLEIAEIILRDSAKIQEEDAERANKEKFTKHSPAVPLYDTIDVEKIVEHFVNVQPDKWLDFGTNIKARWQYNGHILGATFIELDVFGKRIVFSGDIGRKKDLLLDPPKRPKKADILLIESTYGGKNHEDENIDELLVTIINHTIEKGGNLIIPSFAVERTQTIMFILWKLYKANKIPTIPMIMDSPMGANVLEIFQKYHEWHKISIQEFKEITQLFKVVESYKETWEVINNTKSKIIIAGSGMITGGRVLTYLKQLVKKTETSVLLMGYQAEGTRGRQLLEGAEEIKIHGKYVPVKAEIYNCQSLSAHADQTELLEWVSEIKTKPKKVFIIHGEQSSADAFRVKLKDVYDWDAAIPSLNSIVQL
jgi:metallo-beta-lactamase family protein